ncbi:MAG TPA: hypothetical protein PKH10_00485 [bacterium]|nr:hypothetical protein [bacterium]
MRKFTVVMVLLAATILAYAEDVSEISFDPAHREINNDGSLEIYFDLPQLSAVEEVYIEVLVNGMTTVFPGSSRSNGDLSATGNRLSVNGSDLYDLAGGGVVFSRSFAAGSDDDDDLLSDNEVTDEVTVPDEEGAHDDLLSDEDVIEQDDWPAERDGQYNFNLVVVVDRDAVDDDAVPDDDIDVDTDTVTDNDTALVRQPLLYGTDETREPFTVRLDNVPPAAPSAVKTESGNGKIYLTITRPEIDARGKSGESIGRYHVEMEGLFVYEGKEKRTTLSFTFDLKESQRSDETATFTLEGKDGYALVNNDAGVDAYIYAIRVWAEDLAGNGDPGHSIDATGSAATTEGFWSHYKSAGGKEKGDYCFIATVGYGDGRHPHVDLLRRWRDAFLMPYAWGRAFVAAYYDHGPAIASVMWEAPILRPVVQALLFPLVLIAWLMMHPWLAGLLFLSPVLLVCRSLSRRAVIISFLLCFLLLPGMTGASEKDEDDGAKDKKVAKTEKDEEKGEGEEDDEITVHGNILFASGFYDPQYIDRDATGSPMGEILTSDLNYLPALHGGIDIPAGKYLKLTAQAGIGFVELKGRTVRLDGTAGMERSYFYLLPLMAELKLRPVYEFPLRPYIAAGLDYYIWWIIEDKHLVEDGGKFGLHGSVGIQLSLNFFDQKTAIKLREATGIIDTSLFAHYRLERVDNFFAKNGFDLASSRFEFGILFDF